MAVGIAEGWFHFVVVIFEDGGEEVFDGLALTASECEGAGIYVLG